MGTSVASPSAWTNKPRNVDRGGRGGPAGCDSDSRTRRPGGFMAVCAMVLPVVILDLIYARRCSGDRDRCEA